MLSEADGSAEAAGRIAGQMIFYALFLAGAGKCWSISRRPTTNTKCALALMFTLLALMMAGCAGSLAKNVDLPAGLVLATGLLRLGIIGFFLTAIVLAILGLVECSHQRGVYTQGRAQAIWALGLAGAMCLLAVAGFVSGLQGAYSHAAAAGKSQPGKLYTFDELNFRFRAPDRPWVNFDAAKLNKDSKVSFMRRSPEAYFFIIAERLGNQNLTSEQLAEVGKANLQASAASSRVVSETLLRVKGLDGLLVESEAQLGNYPLRLRHWYCATNGYAYQLIGYSRAEDRLRAAGELEDMLSRFELVDPNRMASLSGGFAADFSSPRHHYTVTVTNSAWHAFPSLETSFPQAEFGASQGDSCLVVAPTSLNGEKPGLDALVPAFLAMMDIPYPNEKLTNRKMLTDGRLQGEQFDFNREVKGKTFYYRFNFWQGHDEAYLVAAWTQRRTVDAEAVLKDAFARVRFDAISNSPAPPAPESPPGSTERKTRGFILNQAGLYYTRQSEHEKALPLFCAAVRANGQESVYLLNALFAWQHLDRPREALAFLEAQPAALLAQPAIRAGQAAFQAQASLVDQALTNFAAAFAAGYRDDSRLTDYINVLAEKKQYDTALAAVQNYLKAGDSIAARLMEAQLYRLKQDLPGAIGRLKELHDQNPFNMQVSSTLAETFLLAGRCTEALEISGELARDNADSASASYLKGRCELGLKWYREAKISFASAARLAPANKDIRSYLDYVSGLLGEGDNTAIMDPIEPVALPAALTNGSVEPAPADYAKKYGAYYLRRIVAVAHVPGREYKTTEFTLAKMEDTAGVSAFSTIQVAFDPLGEQVFVNEVRVMDAAGKTISSGNPTNYYVLDDRSSTSASQKKVLNIPVPGLQPGCQLAVTTTRRQQGRIEEFPFLAHFFSAAVPVRESGFFLAGGVQGLNYRSSPALEPEKLPGGLWWRVPDPPVARWEPLQPPAINFLPVLWIADGAARWPAIATNYLAAISDRLEPDAALRSESQKLVAGLDDDEARIAVLASYVQTNLTYKAIEFGRRARLPNKPAEILRNKYGDCKDHAVLLQQMLAAAGVPAQLALAGHRGPVQKDLPSLDQFDHMVVYVPGGGGHFLDCTSKGADVAHAIPAGLAGQDALILDAANPRFVTIPGYPTNASTLSVEQHLHLTGLADVAVEETLTLTGVHAAYLRDDLLPMPESSRRTWLQAQMGMTDAVLTDLKIDSLGVPGEPLRLRFAYTIKGQFRRSNDELRGMLHAGFTRSYIEASPLENRLTPFQITIPFSSETRTAIDVPAGYHAANSEGPNPGFDPRFAGGQARVQVEGGQLRLDFTFRQLAGKFKAPEYAAYRETMAQALSALEREVVFKADGH